MIKKISIILAILVVFMFINTIYISKVQATTFSEAVNEANSWLDKGKDKFEDAGIGVNKITDVIKPIAQALTTIGVGVLLCVAAYMGIKWLTANPEEQAKLKQQSIGLLVSAVVVLGAYTIWSIALKIVSNF